MANKSTGRRPMRWRGKKRPRPRDGPTCFGSDWMTFPGSVRSVFAAPGQKVNAPNSAFRKAEYPGAAMVTKLRGPSEVFARSKQPENTDLMHFHTESSGFQRKI